MKLVVAMTGATGAPLTVRLLEALKSDMGVETHLVVSRWARTTLAQKTGLSVRELQKLASVSYSPDDQGAPISSGSFRVDGMIVVPCSMKTLASIRTGYSDGLIGRAADVMLKERRRLVLVTRETPLSAVHLENMLELTRLGATIMPPVLTFYQQPSQIADLVEHLVARILDQFDLDLPTARRWQGMTISRQHHITSAEQAPAANLSQTSDHTKTRTAAERAAKVS